MLPDSALSSSSSAPPTSPASSSTVEASTSGAANALAVTEHNFAIDPSAGTVAAGTVTLSISNTGPSSHELLIFRTALPDDKLPLGNDARVNEDAIPKVFDTETDLPAGDHRQATVNLPPGRYVLICNLPGHYLSGMHTTVISR
jgi:uncharacterized cupredoxin-like copper-binding protein